MKSMRFSRSPDLVRIVGPQANRAQGLWEATAPAAQNTSPLSGSVSADVAIVGAGFTGLSAALELAERGARVVVLEAANIGHGAAGRNAGLVNAGMWLPPDDLVSVLGAEYGERLLHVLGEAPKVVCELIEKHGIECELERSGTLQCAVGDSGLRIIEARGEQLLRRGAAVEILDAQRTAGRVGSQFYRGALFDRRTATVQPLAYVRGLSSAALRAGARVFTNSPVMGAEQTAKGWRLRTTTGTADAQWIIVATDAYTKGVWPEIARELIHLPYFNIATQPLSDRLRASILPGGEGITDTRTVLSSVRFDRAGRLIIGSIGALRGMGAGIHAAWARRAIRRLFPQIGEFSFEYGWYGSIGMTRSHLPLFHRLAHQVLSVSGYNGRGIAAGTVFGKLLAQLIVGEIPERDIPLPVTTPSPAPFRLLQSLYYEIGAQAAHWVDARISD